MVPKIILLAAILCFSFNAKAEWIEGNVGNVKLYNASSTMSVSVLISHQVYDKYKKRDGCEFDGSVPNFQDAEISPNGDLQVSKIGARLKSDEFACWNANLYVSDSTIQYSPILKATKYLDSSSHFRYISKGKYEVMPWDLRNKFKTKKQTLAFLGADLAAFVTSPVVFNYVTTEKTELQGLTTLRVTSRTEVNGQEIDVQELGAGEIKSFYNPYTLKAEYITLVNTKDPVVKRTFEFELYNESKQSVCKKSYDFTWDKNGTGSTESLTAILECP